MIHDHICMQDEQPSAVNLLHLLHAVLDSHFLTNEDGQHTFSILCCHIRYGVQHLSTGTMCMSHLVVLGSHTAWTLRPIWLSRLRHLFAALQLCTYSFDHICQLSDSQAYLAVPFVEEMRVLTDWTITRTSWFGRRVQSQTNDSQVCLHQKRHTYECTIMVG